MRMKALRKFTALVLTVALANYGVMATAAAHAHEHTGFHQVHADFDGNHGRSDHHGEYDEAGSDTNLPAPEHSETGFHSHSTPQFGPADPGVLLAVALNARRTSSPDPDRLLPLHRDSPPFKPPRT